MLPYLAVLWTTIKSRWDDLRRQPDAGYATETVVVTALLVAAALVIIGIVISKVIDKANSITM